MLVVRVFRWGLYRNWVLSTYYFQIKTLRHAYVGCKRREAPMNCVRGKESSAVWHATTTCPVPLVLFESVLVDIFVCFDPWILCKNSWTAGELIDVVNAVWSTFTYPLTAKVTGTPQMTSQPVFSIVSVLHCPLELGDLQACPFPDVVFASFVLSALPSFSFHCTLQDDFGQT